MEMTVGGIFAEHPEVVPCPLNQVEGVVKALAGQIRDSFSALRNEKRLVVGVVILSSPDVSLTLNKYEHRRDKVLFLHDAAERLVELDSARRNPFVAVSRDSIAQRLGRLQTRQVPKEIGGYRWNTAQATEQVVATREFS